MKLALLISATLVVALAAAGTAQADPLDIVDKVNPGPIKLCPEPSDEDPGCIACGVIGSLSIQGIVDALVDCL